jgi:hypothetical protein
MNANDGLHASIAASLVVAGLSFSTTVNKTPEGNVARTFRLAYKLRGHDCVVTGYSLGVMLTAIAAVRVACPPDRLTSKRHELQDFLLEKVPMVRLSSHPYADPPGDEDVIWVEVSLPVPPGGVPIEPWLAVTPFAAVAGAVDLLAITFADVTPTIAKSFPLLVAERSEREPANVSPPTEPPDAGETA